jgi:3-phenylpropionate/trans-cinnamate dioxygenase ferredoxin subunit
MDAPFEAVADEAELSPGQMKKIQAGGKRLLLCNAEGNYYAVDEMCSHEDYSLYLGCIQGKKIKCSLHGSYFDLATGEALVDPADEPIRTYKVTVSNGKVWVDPS